MGKALGLLLMLVVIDLFFIATGQICSTSNCGVSSIILSSIIEPGSFSFTTFFQAIIGQITDFTGSSSGLGSILVGTAVLLGTIVAAKDFRFFLVPLGITLGLLASDFILIYTYLASLNDLLAVMVIVPTLVAFTFIMLEWVIGKD